MKKALVFTLCLLMMFALFANGKTESTQKGTAPFAFWEHYETFSKMNAALFAEEKAEKGLEVEYSLISPDKMIDSLYVAYRSNQLPDIFSSCFESGAFQLFVENWIQPMTVGIDNFSYDIQNQLFDGLTTKDGKLYSLPLFSQNHCALMFYHPSVVKDVPETYEEFYNECKRIYEESDGKVYGLVLPMAFSARMVETLSNLADAAGNPVINWNTGEYEWDSNEMLELFGLLTRMWDEGLIMPSSINFNMKEARERWAAGEAAFLIDGIWNVGITKRNFMPELNDLAVCEPITPHGEDYMVYANPSNGTYFISNTSNYAEEATDILMKMIEEDFQTKIANVMDQPPFNLSVLETANVAQAYRDSVEIFTKTMGVRPYLGIRNIDALQIEGNMRTVSPNPCEILNGYFAGAIKDYEGALHTYNDQMTVIRNESIKKCQSLGYQVSLDDYIFPNFVYGESYTPDKYAGL